MAYRLLYAVLWLVSKLPFPVLYLASDLLFVFAAYIIRYRRTVILNNLALALPERSEAERHEIMRQFYRHFCDLIVETIKLLSIRPEVLTSRMRCTNPEEISRMTIHGGGGIAVFAHYANWEWLGAGMGLQLPFETVGVYQPLTSNVFNRLVLHIRERLGNQMITMKETYRESIRRLQKPCYIAFLGDQTPPRQGPLYFTSFLGRPTPVFLGIGTIAAKLSVPVYYFDIQKVGRGRYEVSLVRLEIPEGIPGQDPARAITDTHVHYLESVIRKKPAYWLWSHRRWKHTPRAGDTLGANLTGVPVTS